MKYLVDRQFLIVFSFLVNSAAFEAETVQNTNFSDVIPVDYRIKAIHRLYEVVAVPNVDVGIQSTFLPNDYQYSPTIDGEIMVDNCLCFSSALDIRSVWLPDDVDIDFEYLGVDGISNDSYFFDSKILDIMVKSSYMPRLTIQPWKSGTVSSGSVAGLVILECETL